MDKMNLFQRMSKITEEIGVVAKNLNVQTSKSSSYKAVSERDIIDAVKPLEAKYGVYSYPAFREVIESHLVETESEYKGTVAKRISYMSRIKTKYRFVNVDDPSEWIETTVFSEGIDTQDKGSGKAMTYADKYALMKAYKISTGDDPDATASPVYEEPARKPVKPIENAVICPNCGKPVLKEKSTKTGQWFTPEQVLEKCGGVCGPCYREALEKEAKNNVNQ